MLECGDCGDIFDSPDNVCTGCGSENSFLLPPFQTVAALTAEFITTTGSSRLEAKVGALWPTNDRVCYRLIEEVEGKFRRRNKYHSYYDNEPESTSTPSRLTSYINGLMTFEKLVESLMRDLVRSAIDTGSHKVAGGNIVFMHYMDYSDEDVGRLLAVMVDKKAGFDFDPDSLLPKNSTHINLDAMRQAALFDLSLFQLTYPEVPERETYLQFIKGSSKGKFFREAFGCQIRAENSVSVNELYRAIDSFQETKLLPYEFYDKAKSVVDAMLVEAAKRKTSVSASALYEAIESVLDVDSPHRGTFEQFVNRGSFVINEHIEPTAAAIEAENWVQVEAIDQSFNAKVLRDSVGGLGSGEPVEYDADNNQLILKIHDPAMQNSLSKLVR
ncbi:nucleoid-associated protein [Vibrio parahaemolyticus]|uniref:nucleoid-associated protein n=1 Tax=Vibrio parahaemolyticus TaxID=670 RepID=UPI0004D9F507|nr:nucleoid-associated protein [Vibrio parahaemolyticus]EJG0636257.1 nucleoid-associated protein [Vibrio parahaemolyticus]EJG0685599.1 nucleoid-associated protein [Vibrio parahaemolyticus]EJG0698998.1 nucleoid-associated protein [Vibrio parahaemolyticus]EJG0726307.1 nucleoid-associated protein [Vibrio parahaemolyticus]EJG0962172.1 nucleoid-associated protein [Vibrio parahaemolyticus]